MKDSSSKNQQKKSDNPISGLIKKTQEEDLSEKFSGMSTGSKEKKGSTAEKKDAIKQSSHQEINSVIEGQTANLDIEETQKIIRNIANFGAFYDVQEINLIVGTNVANLQDEILKLAPLIIQNIQLFNNCCLRGK
ncbi:MAG: hypothetical protein ACJAW3_000263 [Lentimonas sp.]|jgi:hypothetical protein